jgi:hypothetical protein
MTGLTFIGFWRVAWTSCAIGLNGDFALLCSIHMGAKSLIQSRNEQAVLFEKVERPSER